ncbi:hypothetical protein FQZ97_825930 [compost metagenome]
MVVAWCDITENGSIDPVAVRGVGVGDLARRWWKDHLGEPPAIVVKRLQWALAWPARKKGGMPAKRQRDNG